MPNLSFQHFVFCLNPCDPLEFILAQKFLSLIFFGRSELSIEKKSSAFFWNPPRNKWSLMIYSYKTSSRSGIIWLLFGVHKSMFWISLFFPSSSFYPHLSFPCFPIPSLTLRRVICPFPSVPLFHPSPQSLSDRKTVSRGFVVVWSQPIEITLA